MTQLSPKAAPWIYGSMFTLLNALAAFNAAALGPLLTALGIIAAMAFLLPMMRSAERLHEARGFTSPAIRRYNRRMMLASLGYVVALMGAMWLNRQAQPPGSVAWFIALLPALPVLAMIAAMARLMVEEKDEYLKSRYAHHALVATGATLAVATVYGFLEMLATAPHLPVFWVFPFWAMALGASQLWPARAR